ncbi:uncharacterized protein LOC128175021 isoform X2 [Crassostrea angulata]|uniref:uncharacterized protein LOC128175021 isoform X2 n=1 Tax=Magallana angulata TaxID=2784310 RepID=UPI0022B10AC8|nr:uncharacterized protein LOC128175021 isoform X2 [Crassostrea angulata]
MIPAFEDGKDEMDSYLRTFERYAELQQWPKTSWAMSLSALLKGRALDVYALLTKEDALDYDKLKLALLQRYELTEDGFKRKFRSAKPDVGETFVQYSVRMSSYLQRWLKMAHIAETYEALFDLVLRDQFLNVCNRDLILFLKERTPKSIQDMAQLADQYREAKLTNAANLIKIQGQGFQSSTLSVPGNSKDNPGENRHQNTNKPFVPKSDRRCYKCNRVGHIASECRPKPKVGMVNTQESPDTQETSPVEAKFPAQQQHNMPLSAGYVEGKPVTVLRDTGCSGIVVRTSTFEAWCMEKPVYDLIIGNVEKVRPPGNPDPQWSEARAVETRRQAKAKLKPYHQLRVPEILKENITPQDNKVEQQTCDPLQKVRHVSNSGKEEDYKIDVKGKSKTFHVNMVTKYSDRNADPPNVNQDDEATVSSAVIDRPEDEEVEEYGLPSVGDKEELSSMDINQELGPKDRQKIVGKDQLKAQSDKEKTIDEAVVHVPYTKRKLRTVHGHYTFYKKFIPILLSIVLLFTCLLKQFFLLTDASERGIGAVLMQFDDESGLKLAVANASMKMKDSEFRYSTIEKECLAIVWTVNKFQLYLYGREFLIETDHQSLMYLNRAKVINARIMRLALGLQSYRYRVIAIKVILYWTSYSITLSGTPRYLYIST